jgi:uncharacterized membrane protein YoaK (UPF0700 family)
MRFMESGYAAFVDREQAARRAFGVYGTLIVAFTTGAIVGAVASLAWDVRAIWVPAAILAVTLCLFIIDERTLGLRSRNG